MLTLRPPRRAHRLVVDTFVVDVRDWANVHPGGESVLLSCVGTDATRPFHGERLLPKVGARRARGPYRHSVFALQRVRETAVARIIEEEDGTEASAVKLSTSPGPAQAISDVSATLRKRRGAPAVAVADGEGDPRRSANEAEAAAKR
jgi:hypothetical protein